MKKIAILGGSFDPPHFGHVSVAQAVAEHVDEVWVMPCYSHKFGKKLLYPNIRISLCRDVFRGMKPKIRVRTDEVRYRHESGTYASLCWFREFEKDCEFSFVVGQDNADQIHKFVDSEKLLSEFRGIVVPRAGHLVQDGWYCKAPHVYLKECTPPEISSTALREALKAGDIQRAKTWTASEVVNSCIENKYYG